MKVAVDFVTPEGIAPTFTQSQRLRELPMKHRFKEDRLQVLPCPYALTPIIRGRRSNASNGELASKTALVAGERCDAPTNMTDEGGRALVAVQ